MRLHVVSDLHLEYTDDASSSSSRTPTPRIATVPNTDALVLAGDIGTGVMARDLIDAQLAACPTRPLIYVLGNHGEF
jgi:predicted phosphodiesterase